MILVIDTSATLAVMGGIRSGARDEMVFNARDTPLWMQYPHVVGKESVEKVAVSTGPGSFTGLRVGVSFALGLAIGLRVPIVPLSALDLQAARSDDAVTAVVDAGRGRYYFKGPDGAARQGGPVDIPSSPDLVGNIADPRSLVASGHRFVSPDALRTTVRAAEILLRTAREVPYRNLEIEYMQSFSQRQG